MALILDSEILSGGKQDRVLNQPVMLRPKEVSRVPVSCIEQGRWSSSVGMFSSVGSVPSQLRSERLGIWTETSKSRKRRRVRNAQLSEPALRRVQQEIARQNIEQQEICSTPLTTSSLPMLMVSIRAIFEREHIPDIQGHT